MRPGDGELSIRRATGFRARLLGLAFRREPPHGEALLFRRCRSVHTFGMRFPIDVAFLDEHGRVLRVEREVRGGRVLFCRRALAVLETPSPPRPPAAPGGE